MDYKKQYIDGQYVESDSDEFISVVNPATEEEIGQVPRGNEVDVDKAATAARGAFETFKHTSLEERVEIVENFAKALENRREEMVDLVIKELGAPRFFAEKVQFDKQIARIRRYIEIAQNYEFEREEEETLIRKEPIGVVGALTPWNYPIGQIIQKIIFAILAGNTIVLKPSQQTPLIAYHLVDAFEEAGLPRGVLNLVAGSGGEVGNAIAKHPEVDMVSFTGSTKGGIEVGKVALESVKRVTLELGGKSPAVFLDTSHLEEGVKGTLDIIMNNTGQTCAAWSRAIVLKDIREDFEEEVKAQFGKYKVGQPDDEGVRVGPLASQKQYDKVTSYIGAGKEDYEVLIENEDDLPEKGYFVNPIVFNDVDNDAKIAQDEIFGPVLCVIYVDSVEEAIEVANDTIYGLDGAVFGEEEKAKEVAFEIKTGGVTVNDASSAVGAPFGGYKMSGNGREGGVEGFEEYLETKTIAIK